MQKTIFLLVVLLLAGNAWSAAPPIQPQHSINAPQAATQNKPKTNQPTPLFQTTNPTRVATESGDEQSDRKKQAAIEERISGAAIAEAIFTGLIFVVSAFLAWFTFKLWGSAERTAKRQLRAYVAIDELPEDGKGNLGRDLKFKNGKVRALAYAKNFGQTPAYAVTREIKIEYSPIHDENFSFPEIRYGDRDLLHPGQGTFLDASTEGTFAERKLINSKLDTRKLSFRWHVYGFVSYNDAFGERHYTKFCFWLSWNNGPREAPGWYSCKAHNETEDKLPK